EDVEIVPKFNIAYPADYDGDGETETFIIIKMPYSPPNLRDGIAALRDFVIFADKDGSMEVIDETSDLYPVQFLNYGKFKQIAIGGEGLAGVEAHTVLYGVKDGKLARLYSERCSFAKEDCFLTVYGWQGRRDFMYFDTVLREYVVIDGVDVSAEDIRAMDKTNALAESLDYEGVLEIKLIGGKYYCIVQGYTDWGSVYTYDGESFTLVENSNVVTSLNLCGLKETVDIDIDAALYKMKKPLVEVSPDNEFIDYEFIENYQGTTDIGELADKAVEYLKTTEEYETAMSHFDEIDEEYGEPYIKDGKIVPQFNTAYPADYDGDGTTETFIVVDMPFWWHGYGMTTSFFIFADSGENMTLLDYNCCTYGTVFLDYGKFKQITFGGGGTMGAEDHQFLYGVIDGKVKRLYGGRVSFYKFECFLTTFGWQGSGDFMYYDTAAREYRAIVGKAMTVDEIKAMDKDLTLKEYYDWYDENGYVVFVFIGGKYYNAALGPMDTGNIYTYENGKFILSHDRVRRTSSDYNVSMVADVDVDAAIAEMKPVQK
ncbi:MAG: hypothetical protein NC192_09575, partial [Muribaculaceae bacterium]|nr:hypothetical protein [Muribaculaceae bacterium]